MKFYVTGRSSNITEVERIIALLSERGYEVTFDRPALPMVKPYEENQAKAANFAKDAIQGIIDADVYILLAHHDGTGVFTELGAALALNQLHGKPEIFAVAREIPPVMFRYHSLIHWVKDIEEVFTALGV
jgi:nucleoside 2-deoxyribosyltransferase